MNKNLFLISCSFLHRIVYNRINQMQTVSIVKTRIEGLERYIKAVEIGIFIKLQGTTKRIT